MKKLFVLVLGLIVVKGAWAGCTRLSCGNWDPMNGSVKVSASGNQCWFCGPGPNSCSHLDVVPYKDAVGDVIALYQCHTSELYGLGIFDTNRFISYNPGEFCENSQLKAASVDGVKTDNAKVTYALKGEKTSATSLGDLDSFDGSASCIVVKCNSGYVPNEAKTQCVEPESLCKVGEAYEDGKCVDKVKGCKTSGGTWPSGNVVCLCSADKNLTQNDKYSCKCKEGFDWKDPKDKSQGCYNKVEAKKKADAEKAKQTAKEKCENSWGKYTGDKCVCADDSGLRESNGECVCKDDSFVRDEDSHMCRKDVRKENCLKLSDAEWVGTDCKCRDTNKIFDGTKCDYPAGYEDCMSFSGAEWNGTTCVCPAGYVWKNVTCVEGDNRIVNGFVDKIVAIEKTFDTSKWKNAEGKFNTARLASDSIAGVVLGTVGGVVTSTVVKKNQVKNGFEDIKCVIGGQTVASWGDQINVGLQ